MNNPSPASDPFPRPADPAQSPSAEADSTAGSSESASAAEQQAEQARRAAEELLGLVKERLQPLAQWARQMTQEHPVLMLGAGVGILALTARLMRRRK